MNAIISPALVCPEYTISNPPYHTNNPTAIEQGLVLVIDGNEETNTSQFIENSYYDEVKEAEIGFKISQTVKNLYDAGIDVDLAWLEEETGIKILGKRKLELALGFSHNIVLNIAPEVKVEAISEKGKNPVVKLTSFDKQLVGQVAAKIRGFRRPEPYKGKGIKFVGEEIRRKAGKTA